MAYDSPHLQLDALLAAGDRVAMATLVAATGSTPKKAGAKMWVDQGGAIAGTVTIGGCVDARVIEMAGAVLEHGEARLLDLALGDEEAWEIGLTCGGTIEVLIELVRRDSSTAAAYALAESEIVRSRPVIIAARTDGNRGRLVVGTTGVLSGTLGDAALDEAVLQAATGIFDTRISRVETVQTPDATTRVFFEHLAPPRLVVIVGAVEVARSLALFARELGMHTIVVDPRERFLTRERFPEADELRAGIPSQIVAAIPMTANVSVVLVAHDYKYELPVLREVLRSHVAYIGLLGGRKRRDAIRQALADEGFTADEIAHVRAPIGIDIGASSTAEIALAIAAELVAVERRGGTGRTTGM